MYSFDHLSRRQFAQLAAAAAGFVAGAPLAWGTTRLPSPDFTLDDYPRFVAGLRPYREDTFRLEQEFFDERTVIHNYGHGGSGVTLSWGVAFETLDMLRSWTAERSLAVRPDVAVLGAGVIGLTAAMLLVEAGFRVTVYAKGFLEETTSHVAGGQFCPSSFAFHDDPSGMEQLHRILRRSFRQHESKIGKGFGVLRRPNYTYTRTRGFELIPRDVVPAPESFTSLPFAGHERRSGFCYQTLLIEPPIFLRRLELDLRLAGVRMIRTEFASFDDILATLDESVIVNCMGLGAGTVMNDSKVVSYRGQLVLLKPQPQLEYLYSGPGYIFPRSDCVVVGGTYEPAVTDLTPDPVMCAEVLAKARAPFEVESLEHMVPSWMRDPLDV